MLKRVRRALSPSMVVSLLALFVALSGVGIAATGGNFILGTANTATSTTGLTASGTTTSALKVTNTNTAAGSTALELNVRSGMTPMKVNSKTRVLNLNADAVDGLGSSAWVRRGVATTDSVTGANGVVDVTNTGTGNGVQGKTTAAGASGVYGEHVGGGGFGVAGRAGNGGHAIYGDNTGDGFAGYFEDKVHVGGTLDASGALDLGGNLNCSGCVDAGDVVGKVGNADLLDGLDSGAFMQAAQGSADGQAVATGPNTTVFLGAAIGGLVRLRYQCPFNLGGTGLLRIINASAGAANLFVDSGGANPDYLQLGSGGFLEYPTAAGGESFFIQMQGSPGVALVSAATVHRSTDCHAQAFGVIAG
jgi:hypothetical protein